MNYLTGSKSAIDAHPAACDKAMGMPRPAGRHVGGGIHAPDEQAVTLHFAETRKHPTRELWAAPAMGGDGAKLAEDWTPKMPEDVKPLDSQGG
mgnify:FL=1